MTTADPDLAQELSAVERARSGDHDAFVALYRQDAPPAWRLALALTNDPNRAADAVARAFARTLSPVKAGTARIDVAFRLRLLAATRHVVLDLGLLAEPASAPAGPADAADPEPLDDTERARRRAAEVLHAFHQLPERWRTVLWLHAVEGIDTPGAAGIVGVSLTDAEELAARSVAGLQTQWTRDRIAAGDPDPVAPDRLERRLQPVLPLPLDLFADAEAHWQATRRPAVGPLRLALPGGRPVPRWAERSLLASTAALIALGITSALVVDRDPEVRRIREGLVAAPPAPATSTTLPQEPKAYLDGDPGDVTPAPGTTGPPPSADATTGGPAAVIAATSTGGATVVAGRSSEGPASPTTTAPPPMLQATLGLGPALGVSLGDDCTGIEVGGRVAGCPPPTEDDGVTVDLGGALVGD